MKKLIVTLLTLCLLLSLAVPVLADETTGTTGATTEATEPKPATEGMCGGNVKWKVEGTTMTISGSGKMSDFTEGETPWNHYKDTLTTIKFGDGVTHVGNYAFKGYDKLTSVSFAHTGKVSLGVDCLRGCKNLKRIDFAGRFPKFETNCLWDTYCTLYYSAANPWPADTIKTLEDAFKGRIEFRGSDGSDPVKPTEAPKPTEPAPTEKPKPKPTTGNTPTPTETVTTPTWSVPTETITTPTFTLPTYISEAEEEEQEEGGFSGWIAVVVVIGLLAGFAAVTIHVQEAQRRKRRKQRRPRPDFQ